MTGPADHHQRFVQLLTRHHHQIVAYIAAAVANLADADDVMQETSVALWEMFDQFREGTSFPAWACRVAHFRVLRFRQQRGRDRHEFATDVLEALAGAAAEEIDHWEDRRRALDACLDRLPPADRVVIRSCYADGATIQAAADRLGRSAKAVYKSLARIRNALYECVQNKTGFAGVRS